MIINRSTFQASDYCVNYLLEYVIFSLYLYTIFLLSTFTTLFDFFLFLLCQNHCQAIKVFRLEDFGIREQKLYWRVYMPMACSLLILSKTRQWFLIRTCPFKRGITVSTTRIENHIYRKSTER
jgi:hypothetical protein